MSKGKNITFKSLQKLVRAINVKCKAKPEDERLQEQRRALLAIRRAINGEQGVTEEQLLAYAQIMSDSEREVAKKLEAIKLDGYALQRLQLADDIDEQVLVITTVELEEETEIIEIPETASKEEEVEVNGNVG